MTKVIDVAAESRLVGRLSLPDRLFQVAARDDVRGSLHQPAQDAQADRSQVETLSSPPRDETPGVELQIRHAEHTRGAPAPACQRFDPGSELLQRERLDQVVVGPGAETLQLVGEGIPRREHEDRRLDSPPGPELTAQLEAVQGRKPQVEDDDVERLGAGEVEPDQAVHRVVRGPAPGFAVVADIAGDVGVVFDDEHAHPPSILKLPADAERRQDAEPAFEFRVERDRAVRSQEQAVAVEVETGLVLLVVGVLDVDEQVHGAAGELEVAAQPQVEPVIIGVPLLIERPHDRHQVEAPVRPRHRFSPRPPWWASPCARSTAGSGSISPPAGDWRPA